MPSKEREDDESEMTKPFSRNSELYPPSQANTSHHKEIFSSRLLILFFGIIISSSPCFYVFEAATCEWKSVIALMMISWIFFQSWYFSIIIGSLPSSKIHTLIMWMFRAVMWWNFSSSMQMRLLSAPFILRWVSIRVEILLMELHYRNFVLWNLCMWRNLRRCWIH